MSVGKYSPTVAAAYHDNQGWWDQHCENEGDLYDRDGYDEYGYDEHGRDRAGYLEKLILQVEHHLVFILSTW